MCQIENIVILKGRKLNVNKSQHVHNELFD